MQCEVVLNFIISILGLIEVIAPPHEVAYIFRYQNFAFEYSPPPPPQSVGESHIFTVCWLSYFNLEFQRLYIWRYSKIIALYLCKQFQRKQGVN